MSEPDDTTASQRVVSIANARRVTATFIVVAGDSSIGKMYKLNRQSMIIGRTVDSDIWLNDEGVSRRHAKILVIGDEIQLVDLNSKNGTFCNGERIDSRVLKDGDKIQIGTTTILKFSYQDSLDEALQKNLYESATMDGLTRIFNRKFFLESLKKEFAFALRHKVPLSLLMIDIDHFKKVNDEHGHQAGDYVLTRIAAAIDGAIRTEDIFARYGGEEFALILREAPEERAIQVADRLVKLIAGLALVVNKAQVPVTISIGVATADESRYRDVDEFLQAADRYLYRAKNNGRNQLSAFAKSGA